MDTKIDFNEIDKLYKEVENVKMLASDMVLMLYRQYPDNIKEITDAVAKYKEISANDIKNAKKQLIKNKTKTIEATTLPEFIKKYFSLNGIDIDIQGSIKNKPDDISENDDVEMELILRASNNAKIMFVSDIATNIQNEIIENDYPKEWRPYDYIQRNIISYMNDTTQEKRLEVIQPLMMSKGGFKDYMAFLDAARIISNDNPDYVAAVLYHFIWQAKRKMTGFNVDNHMMPIFTGKQNCGKSRFVNDYLLKPITGLFTEANFTQVGDDRNVALSTNNYVLFCDEMIGSNKTENNIIKNAISRKDIQYRPMGTNASLNVPNNVTFIGCTNESLADLIKDDTGARRFPIINYGDIGGYESPWMNPKFNEIDWFKLWCNVNPKEECVFKRHPNLLGLTMDNINENKYISPLQHWFSDMDDKPKSISPKDGKAMYLLYAEFIKTFHQSSKPISSTKFFRELSNYADEHNDLITKHTDRNRNKTYYWNK